MYKIWETNNEDMSLHVTISCNGKKRFRLWAENYGKKNSKYADRVIEVDGKRTVFLSFPITPKNLFIGCLNADNPNDKEFTVEIIRAPLKTYNVNLDSDTKEFMRLAEYFSQVCGFKRPAENGTLYKSGTGKFNIRYYMIIRDVLSGAPLGTPARIGHKSGNIDVSAYKFIKYTIPMRICILLHEFSHKYKNPKLGLQINNEIGADINALYIYLGMGFSKIDAICVFGKVFLKAQTPGNQERMRKIMDFIQKFENQEFAEKEY